MAPIMNKYLILAWEVNGNAPYLTLEFIPEYVFLLPRYEGKHITAIVEAECLDVGYSIFESRSLGNIVELNYKKKKNKKSDTGIKVVAGVMTLDFDSLTKESLRGMHWMAEGDNKISHAPGDLIVNASWKDIECGELNENASEDALKKKVPKFIKNAVVIKKWTEFLKWESKHPFEKNKLGAKSNMISKK